MVRSVRQSLGAVPHRERKQVALELEAIYRAPTEAPVDAGLQALEQIPLGNRYPTIAPIWRRHWESARPVFASPPH
jgi:transposase-like protein